MKIIENLKPWLGRKSVRGAIALLLIIVAIGAFGVSRDNNPEETVVKHPVVRLTSPTEYSEKQSLSVIGTVRAFSEAVVTSERAGRVVSVNVTLGQQVGAGTVLASLENASERAFVLQAEGVHDAAVAATAQTDVGVNEAQTTLVSAQNNAVSAFKSAYNTTNGIIRNSIDTFFSNPDAGITGLKIDGRGFTSDLNVARVSYQTLLPTWQSKTNTISISSDLNTELEYAEQSIQKTITFVDNFLTVFSLQKNSPRYTDAELQTFISTFTSLRSTLIGLQSTIDSAKTGLISANDAVKRAGLAASGSVSSSADAQVKQALGNLQSAQANLAKTILRTPISGTVNSISIRTGDFIGAFDKVAVVANNNALEIVIFVSDSEKKLISVGDVMLIENKFEGLVTQIAPAVDSATRKTEVRIATEGIDISNGDTVRVSKEYETVSTDTTIRVPLTAVKFNRSDGFIFMVKDNRLVRTPVTLGAILGGSVEIIEGLGASDEFVIDARGLIDGEEVQVSE